MSRTPENVSVITAEQIVELNAHTLSDILAVIPGVQLEHSSGPTSGAAITIQGAEFNHILLVVDGIPFNNLADSFPDPGVIPAYMIERVEIVKGAASSSWGSALGGVINVITKSPDTEHKVGGALSASYGERSTDDAHVELSGTVKRLGYQLSAGHFGTGGFQPNTQSHLGSSYGRFTYDLPGDGRISLSCEYLSTHRGEFATEAQQAADRGRRLLYSLSLAQPLSDGFDLELAARNYTNEGTISVTGVAQSETQDSERVTGGSAKLLWRTADNILVLGADYDRLHVRLNEALRHAQLLARDSNRWGFYLNDSYTVGRLTVAPGVRYDLTGTASGSQWSPSLGATWQAGENTTVRGYLAKGYSVPSFLLESAVEKVWTVQVGAETSALPHLWLKGTLFRNQVSHFDGNAGDQRQVKQGVETEVRTSPFFHTSLSLGYTFVDVRQRPGDAIVANMPREMVLLGVRYDDERLLRLLITGRHVDWRSTVGGRYGGVLWDAHLTVTPFGRGDYLPELFVSVHNAFDNDQYLLTTVRNPGLWSEGGVRWHF